MSEFQPSEIEPTYYEAELTCHVNVTVRLVIEHEDACPKDARYLIDNFFDQHNCDSSVEFDCNGDCADMEFEGEVTDAEPQSCFEVVDIREVDP